MIQFPTHVHLYVHLLNFLLSSSPIGTTPKYRHTIIVHSPIFTSSKSGSNLFYLNNIMNLTSKKINSGIYFRPSFLQNKLEFWS